MVSSFSLTTAVGIRIVPTGLGFMLQDRGELFSGGGAPQRLCPGNDRSTPSFPLFCSKTEPFMSYGLMGVACSRRVTCRFWLTSPILNEPSGSGDGSIPPRRWFRP